MNQFSPTKRVTDLLLTFLEFDPQQLQLGIWSGDLSLDQVRLRPDALEPFLKQLHQTPSTTTPSVFGDSSTLTIAPPLAPLVLKLVSGTVGSIRLRIPWKRLVWGQGDVQMEVDDVVIVVRYESRYETQQRILREQRRQSGNQSESSDEDNTNSTATTDGQQQQQQQQPPQESSYLAPQVHGQDVQRQREWKQAKLREAERRNLQGLPLASWMSSSMYQDEDEATGEAANTAENQPITATTSSSWGRWFQKASRDFLWRFCAGLRARVNKVRIVLVQENLEMGLLIHSIDMVAGEKADVAAAAATAPNSTTPDDHDSSTEESVRNPSVLNSVQGQPGGGGSVILQYRGAYEDGEHVDKTIQIQGVGIFIRKEVNQQKVHPSLAFSSYCTADDFLLRPTNVKIKFSLFLPNTNSKRKTSASSNNEVVTAPSTTATTRADATIESSRATTATTTSSKRQQRRGKRDKVSLPPSQLSSTAPTSRTRQSTIGRSTSVGIAPFASSPTRATSGGQYSNENNADPTFPSVPPRGILRSASIALIRETSRMSDEQLDKADTSDHRRFQSMHPTPFQNPTYLTRPQPRSGPLVQRDDLSAAYVSVALKRSRSVATPRCDGEIKCQELFVCCSSRHLDLLQRAWVGLTKMKRGRPDQTIQSVLYKAHQDFYQRPTGTRFITVEAPVAPVNEAAASEGRPPPPPQLPELPWTDSPRRSRKRHSHTQVESSFTTFASSKSVQSEKEPTESRPSRFPSHLALPKGRARTDGSIADASPVQSLKRMKLELHLQLPAVATELSKVVQQWWKYAIDVALSEVRQRRKMRSHFAERNIFFDWDKVTHHRKEYVDLYIRTKLHQSSWQRNSESEALLKLEDELNVEQILLYRAIARALSVRRITKMPDSVLTMHGASSKSPGSITLLPRKKQGDGENLPGAKTAANAKTDVEPSFLSKLRSECQAIRSNMKVEQPGRKDDDASMEESEALSIEPLSPLMKSPAKLKPNLQPWSPSTSTLRRTTVVQQNKADNRDRKYSVASLAVETNQVDQGLETDVLRPDNVEIRTVKTYQTTKSRQSSGSAFTSLLDNISVKAPSDDLAMKYSVSISFDRLEVMLIHETVPVEGSIDGHKTLIGNSTDININAGTMLGSDELSDVSALSDDQMFFSDQWEDQIGQGSSEENSSSNEQPPMIPSTDFFQLNLPSNRVLHVILEKIDFSVLGKSGQSRNVNFSFDRLSLLGEEDVPLVSLKPSLSSLYRGDSTPMKEVVVGVGRKGSVVGSNYVLDHAITTSFVETDKTRLLQLDAARLSATLDFKAIAKLVAFASMTKGFYLGPLVPLSSNDGLRRFMLNKSKTSYASLFNSAFRLHGLELSIPQFDDGDDQMSHTTESSDSFPTSNNANSATVSAEILELYSGAFLDELGAGANENASKKSASRARVDPVAQRAQMSHILEMIDVDAFAESQNSQPWV
jgi:hypothetical protein